MSDPMRPMISENFNEEAYTDPVNKVNPNNRTPGKVVGGRIAPEVFEERDEEK